MKIEMGKIYFIIILALLILGCGNSKNEPKGPPVVVLDKIMELTFNEKPDTIDLGNLKEGVITEFTVRLINIDTIPRLIIDIIPDCGCTAIVFDKKPVMPGGYSDVTMSYDSRNQSGTQLKNMRLITSINESSKNIFLKSRIETGR